MYKIYIVLRDFLALAFPLNQPLLELTFSCLMNKSKGEKNFVSLHLQLTVKSNEIFDLRLFEFF